LTPKTVTVTSLPIMTVSPTLLVNINIFGSLLPARLQPAIRRPPYRRAVIREPRAGRLATGNPINPARIQES
jgi:hypothetical protein